MAKKSKKTTKVTSRVLSSALSLSALTSFPMGVSVLAVNSYADTATGVEAFTHEKKFELTSKDTVTIGTEQYHFVFRLQLGKFNTSRENQIFYELMGTGYLKSVVGNNYLSLLNDYSDGNMMFELANIDKENQTRTYNGLSCTSTYGDCGGDDEIFTLTFDPATNAWSLFYVFDRASDKKDSEEKQRFTGTVLMVDGPWSH